MLALSTTLLAQFGSVAPGKMGTLVAAVGAGVVGGIISGLLGTSLGGGIVVLSTLLLGADQHLAQGISLATQIPPASVSGIRCYRAAGHGCSLHWLLWLAAGMLVGGAIGALVAAHASSSVLRWSYAGYLTALDLLLIVRSAPERVANDAGAGGRSIGAPALLLVGLTAGMSSGFLSIGAT